MSPDYLMKWIDSGTNSLTISFVSDQSEVREGFEVMLACVEKNTPYSNRYGWDQRLQLANLFNTWSQGETGTYRKTAQNALSQY